MSNLSSEYSDRRHNLYSEVDWKPCLDSELSSHSVLVMRWREHDYFIFCVEIVTINKENIMSFYRTLFAAIAAIAIASPVFAEDATPAPAGSTSAPSASATTAPATENSSMTQPSTSSEQGAATEAKVNVNKATAKDLMKVKGINASKARHLVACRKKQNNHAFKSLDDIAKCKGFTKMKAEDLKAIEDQLTVE